MCHFLSAFGPAREEALGNDHRPQPLLIFVHLQVIGIFQVIEVLISSGCKVPLRVAKKLIQTILVLQQAFRNSMTILIEVRIPGILRERRCRPTSAPSFIAGLEHLRNY